MPLSNSKQNLIIGTLSLVALGLLISIFYTPVWWVSLKAPQYPDAAFPQGIRIHFHVNGVFNGCQKVETEEKYEEEALNCKHEMDAINHYVGMYPIAAGAPIERAVSPFVFVLLGLMVIAFALPNNKQRILLMGAGSLLISGWSYSTLYTEGGIATQSSPYREDLMSTMQLTPDEISSWSGIEAIQASYEESLARYFPTIAVNCESYASKMTYVDLYASQGRPFDELNDLLVNAGATSAVMSTFHELYKKIQKNPDMNADQQQRAFMQRCELMSNKIGMTDVERTEMMITITHIVFFGLLGAMALLVIGLWKMERIFKWVLVLVPMALPLFFIMDYAGWLWWFGHHLSEMGAFTVKPFMPTVFGVGKVAQFSTYSYPYYGFGLIMLNSVVLAAAALIRLKSSQ
ncbi:MAG: hypothetical protein HON68_05715 [Gammaproteobacteria bacterium]|jgi:hypothetical protein|nr:hypothetical protein [Gammaproteobacteria bacterium]MBT3489927.1 hypothetical protein [Gammaproteobacteria bacterium]MBT3718852.1 hypothetical protein [Gammaproteobacteria bacterium]MBT3843761.1 hypothetical protein [Gammaproteobacteria bacterium]MBT3893040.1 hypothetical protein [Gammaproteobacteria bacterium]